MKIPVNIINKIAYIYISIPLFIFLFFWLDTIYAAITVLALTYILFNILKKQNDINENMEIGKIIFIATVAIAFLWCYSAGIGGFFYQNHDWHFKNATLHDLINFSWPVIYDNGSALVYYFGYFLPLALFGKLFAWLGCDAYTAFRYANYFELFWGTIGISLVFLKLYTFIKVKNSKKLFICLLFIFFSGMDILIKTNEAYMWHLEWHYSYCNYPSNTSILFWANNQVIYTWLIISLFINEYKNLTNSGFYTLLMFFYAPLQALGFILYPLITALTELFNSFKEKRVVIFIKQIFNIKNILSIIIIFPVVYLFLQSNYVSGEAHLMPIETASWMIFWLFAEALAFLLLLLAQNYKSPLYWIMFIYLTLLPFCSNTIFQETIMRVSLPSLAILSVFTIKLILTEITENQRLIKVCKHLIIICFLIGTVTPFCEITRGIYMSLIEENVVLIQDDVKTLNNQINTELVRKITNNEIKNRLDGYYLNYGSIEPYKCTFWKYIASKNRKL